MSLPRALRSEATSSAAVTMRLATIMLMLVLGVLVMLAAPAAQTTPDSTSHSVLVELDNAPRPPATSDEAPGTAGKTLTVGLATGCIILIACCALGLALRSGRAWRPELFTRRNSVAKPLGRAVAVVPLICDARPSLVALSISRR